jgi:hypothetical protein
MGMKRPWDAVAWWEIRRIPFNPLILAVGLVSGLIFVLVGERVFEPRRDLGSPLIAVVLYALAANLCYTLGWVSELLWAWGDTAQTERMRPKVFRLGLVFSAILTLLPAVVLSLVWAARGFR